jgi:anti-sigma regulatory factor (Ser/Thr protein kinase)
VCPEPCFQHEAVVYSADRELVDRVVPYLDDGLAKGEPVIAVLTRSNWALLREALGPVAASNVGFTDCDAFYVRPAHAIASYDATVQRHLNEGSTSVRVVGELPFGPAADDWHMWTGYEALLNRALADRPAQVMCTYDERVLPEELVDIAWQTHPHVATNGTLQHSDHYVEPETLLRALSPAPMALSELRELVPTADPAGFREQLSIALADAGVGRAKATEMLLAAQEVYVNAQVHGGGASTLRAGTADGFFVCEISDDGPGLDDPLAGYMPPRAGSRPAAGLWVARQLVSRLELIPGSPGLTARLWL